jgi:hypothetical protein
MKLSNKTITDSGLKTYLQSIYNLNDATTSVAVKLINKGLEIEEVIAIAVTKDLQTLTTVFSLLEENLDVGAVIDAAKGFTDPMLDKPGSDYSNDHMTAYSKLNSLVAA